jgi:hypothetical protein
VPVGLGVVVGRGGFRLGARVAPAVPVRCGSRRRTQQQQRR